MRGPSCRRGLRAAALALLLGTVALGRPVGADTVRGYVLDATSQERVAGVEVAFLVAGEAGGMTEMVSRSTDEAGAFEFSGPFLKPGTAFSLRADHDGMGYQSGVLRVGEQDQVILEVYDATASDDRIVVDGHNLFLAVTEAGIDAAQLVQIDNIGDATFVGADTEGAAHVLEFGIPASAQGLQGHSGTVHRGAPNRVFTTDPVAPGRSQLTFSYQIPGDAFDGDYVFEARYPTRRLELFLQPATIDWQAPGVEDLGTVALHESSYRHYRILDLAPGRRVEIPLPFARPLRWALKWVLAALVPVAILVAVSLTRPLRPASAGAAAGVPGPGRTAGASLEERRQRLLDELVRLDQEREQASGPTASRLQAQRDRLKAELAEIYRQLGTTA